MHDKPTVICPSQYVHAQSFAITPLPHLLLFRCLFPLSCVCICSLYGCNIGVDGARAIGAAVSKDRQFQLGVMMCVM